VLPTGDASFRRLVETSHDGICVVDATGIITYASARLGEMLACEPGALTGQSIFDLMAPDAAFDARTRFARRQRGIREVDELPMRRMDGGTLWVRKASSSIFADDGTFTGAVYALGDITARRQADETLRENERRYRLLFDGNPMPMYVGDAETRRFLAVNDAAVAHYGYPREQFLAMRLDDIRPPEARAAFVEEFQRNVARDARGFYQHVRRDGSLIDVEIVANAVVFGDRPAKLVLAIDVTERRRAQAALRESEARYAHVAAHVPGIVYQYVYRPDGTTGFTVVSEGARELFGVAPEAIVRDQAAIFDLVHPEDRPSLHASGAAAVAALLPWRWEGRVVLPTGEEKWVQVASRNERQPDGSILADGLLMDVTERKRAARQLEESEQRHRSLFEQHPDAVVLLDTEGRFVAANAACEAIGGYTPDELVGRSFASFIVPEHRDLGDAYFDAAVRGRAQRHELAIVHKTGRRVELAMTNIPVVVGGRVVGVFGIAKDLSAQRELEAQLRQAVKMEAVGRLAGGVAHDFNNLLTVIQSYGTFVAAELPEGSHLRADVDEVLKAADRAAALTRQLLAFGRRQMLQPRRLDVNQTVAAVAGMLRRLIGEDVALETACWGGVWPVYADPGQLEQVLMNLAVNARDAMPNGGTLRLRTANESFVVRPAGTHPALPAGDYVAIAVEDTGSGMGPEVLPHLFEPFYTTKEPGKGTGLGLATVYGIVEQSGGGIAVATTPGRGSRFTVLLPRSDAREDVAGRVSSAVPGGDETILLVEDEAKVRMAVRRMLERQGYTVREAASGAEALRLIDDADVRLDLVLTDVVMPELSGRAMAERIAVVRPGLRVLYMSGYTDDEMLRRGLTQPGTAFLEKPFTGERLARAVRDALDGPR
jgi:PAS domain S-box-containing protein